MKPTLNLPTLFAQPIRPRNTTRLIVLRLSALAKLCLLVVWLSSQAVAETDNKEIQKSKSKLPLQELQVFTEVFGQIKKEYVDKVDDQTLLRNAIHGMLNGLDPHSTFLDPEAFEEMRISTEGQFSGLGMEITIADGLIKVIAPIDDTPAYRAGIQPGDVIVRVDGITVKDVNLREVVDSMRGPSGSEIVLTVSRQDHEFDVTLVREMIKITSVKSEMLEDGFAYIRITSFQSQTSATLRTEIEKMQRQSQGKLDGIVLDLRNNPGGTLQSAVEVTDAFLDEGVIVSTRGRSAEHSFNATAEDLTENVPVVVLVNDGSASAAEIVAGALQDHDRAIIVGTTTFGKGSVQTVLPMNNGGALKLTTARYYTPSERSIQALGIVPDIIVASTPTTPPPNNVDADQTKRESNLFRHLKNERTKKEATKKRANSAFNSDSRSAKSNSNRTAKTDSILTTPDHQLDEALSLLKAKSQKSKKP